MTIEQLREQIARRAYALFEARSGANGSALGDWLQAEEEVLSGLEQSRVRHYGAVLAEYRGTGTVEWANSPKEAVSFEAGQLHDGECLVVWSMPTTLQDALRDYFGEGIDEPIVAFEGITADGSALTATESIDTVNYLPRMRGPGKYSAIRARQLDIVVSDQDVTNHRFGLVNFYAEGMAPIVVRRGGRLVHTRGLAVQLRVGQKNIDGAIISVERAQDLRREVMTTKTCRVLSELIVQAGENCDSPEFTKALADLCLVLSVARGTRVQWVYRQDWNESGVVRISHRSNLTKPYCPLAPIPSAPEYARATTRFIANALDVLPDRQAFLLDQGTVGAYLDAKAEGDYTQIRGAKLAVTIERLKDVFLAIPGTGVSEFVLAPADFKKLVPQIVGAVNDVLAPSLPVQQAKEIASASKMLGLNRTPFRLLLTALCQHVGFTPSSRDLALFIASRNSLVHTGEFYCDAASVEKRNNLKPLADRHEEFFFLVSFLDRLFLKLLNYSGPYCEWRKLGTPTFIQHLP